MNALKNKVVPFLEQYVQWIALGLGAAFMLFMIYTYVLNNPVKQEVGGKPVDLGNVDKVTLEGPANDLKIVMNQPNKVDIKVEPIDFSKTPAPIVLANVDAKLNAPTKAIEIVDPNAPKTAVVKTGAPGIVPNDVTGNLPPQLDELPKPPAAIFLASSVGRSSVVPLPPAPGAAPLPVGPNGQPLEIDKNWVSFHYKIPVADLAKAFANVPPARQFTSFLRIEMVREERDSGGQWVNPIVVPQLAIATQDVPPWPGDPAANSPAAPAGPLYQPQNNNDANAINDPAHDYITWTQTHIQSILQPVFYQVTKGSIPGLPGDPVQLAGVVVQQKVFDPAHPGLPSSWTPEQKKMVEDYRRQKAEELRNRRSTPRTPRATPGRRGTPGGEGDVAYAPRDNDRPILLAQVGGYGNPGVPGRGYNSGLPEDMGDGGVGMTMTQQNNEALQKLTASLPKDPLINPANFLAQLQLLGLDSIDVIAYDESGEPGKTYRYRMQYHVLNPIYGSPQLVKNPAAAAKFNIVSVPSEWTAPIEVPPAVSFFVASAPAGSDNVTLELFRWQNGNVNKTTQKVSPGDRIGMKITQAVPVIGPDGRPVMNQPAPGAPVNAQPVPATVKQEIDYTTPWTVVDVRSGNGDRYVILRNESGETTKRELRGDTQNPTYKELKDQVLSLAPVPAAADGTFPNYVR